ncbi:glycerate kinase [Aeropyrum pernix K1]|uniref:Glycerate kinase n=1 Tax=Aeropyrum pernix (strain ATCC 700893 / DSM 11879 / JCM 9820 / NBRC 100138 / K1) TaxID=272557 RepID=Q9YDB7_AERPE|nr:glycerate kinase [Aeropyrum pernix]BAA79980.2 glycerate kinase [Aeropyrum pernix K1]
MPIDTGPEGQRRLVSILREAVGRVLEASRLDWRVRRLLEERGLCRSRAVVLALGKGSLQMARGALECLEPEGGVVVKPRGMTGNVEGLEVVEGSHPLPDEWSLRAGRRLLEWAGSAGEGDNVVVLVSGGGSALAEVPMEGLALEDLREVNMLLLKSGASIHEINTVRKHLSRIKGGRLAATAYPARVLGVYASDVPGDRLDMIASGPTVPDPTTYGDALAVLERYGLRDSAPPRVVALLEAGARGEVEETPKPGDRRLSTTENRLAASNMDVLEDLAAWLGGRGFNTLVLTSRLEGESREVGRALASIALEALDRGVPVKPPAALLAGGETTVTVRGGGRGGRNMELALAWSLAMAYWSPEAPAAILAMDTDGIDGRSDAAGAVAWPWLPVALRDAGLDPYQLLADNDSERAFAYAGSLVSTGLTGTNLNSVVVVLLGPPPKPDDGEA